MTVTTVRPDSTPNGVNNFQAYGGAASIQAALSDNLNTTYIMKDVVGNGTVTVGFGTTTIPATERVTRVRVKSAVTCPTANARLTVTPICRVNGVSYKAAAQTFAGVVTYADYAGAWFTTAPDGQAWDQTRIDGLRAQISDNASGVDLSKIYELYFDIETTVQPTVTVASPTGTITTTSQPEVAWTYSDADGTDQAYYWVKVFDSATYGGAGFDPEISVAQWDSGAVASSDNTVTVGSYLLGGAHRAYVKVAKLVSGVAFYSDWQYSGFTLTLTTPTTPTVTTTYLSATNRVQVRAVGGAPVGAFASQTFQIQRSDDGGTTFTDVYGGEAATPDGNSIVTFYDYTAPRAATAKYRVRAVGYTTGGEYIASAWSSASTVTVSNDGLWWFKALRSPELNVGGARVVAGFDGKRDEQVGVFRPLGRSTAVVISAGLQGTDGKMVIKTVGMTEFDSMWALVAHLDTVLIQGPEPQQRPVRIVERSFQRTGSATNPVSEITIGYVEVEQ